MTPYIYNDEDNAPMAPDTVQSGTCRERCPFVFACQAVGSVDLDPNECILRDRLEDYWLDGMTAYEETRRMDDEWRYGGIDDPLPFTDLEEGESEDGEI